jgi:hypothetical protein
MDLNGIHRDSMEFDGISINPGNPFRSLFPSEDLISHLRIEMSPINILVGISINIEVDPSIFHGIETLQN